MYNSEHHNALAMSYVKSSEEVYDRSSDFENRKYIFVVIVTDYMMGSGYILPL